MPKERVPQKRLSQSFVVPQKHLPQIFVEPSKRRPQIFVLFFQIAFFCLNCSNLFLFQKIAMFAMWRQHRVKNFGNKISNINFFLVGSKSYKKFKTKFTCLVVVESNIRLGPKKLFYFVVEVNCVSFRFHNLKLCPLHFQPLPTFHS